MIRHLYLMVMPLTLALMISSPAWAQNASAVSQVDSFSKHKPTLAIAVSAPKGDEQNRMILEDLLMVELTNQSFLQLVDRKFIPEFLKEHVISLSNLNDTKNTLALGKFDGADYLLHVLAENKTVTIRLVEVATGQVKLEEQVALTDDLALSSAAIREKVLAALHPESQAANRLTVGIAAFPNGSGTGRSDKLGIELQKVLRSRLKDKAWAIVLERQYPMALLDEVDLARGGLVREGAVEKLPPADLVIFGTMQDVDKEYVAGKSWEVKLDLTLRLRDKSTRLVETFSSDAIEAAADQIAGEIDKFRRQPTSQTAVTEKELWRRQALYLMPRQIETWLSCDYTLWQNRVLIPNFAWSTKLNQLEVIRAWENVLLLDGNDTQALNYLGVCLISIDRWKHNQSDLSLVQKRAAADQCIAGSLLVERALKMKPSRELAASYVFCIGSLRRATPTRAKEMAQFVHDHPELFKDSPKYSCLKAARTTSAPKLTAKHYVDLDRAIANAERDHNAVLIMFPPKLTRKGPLKQYGELLRKHQDSPDPVVQFVVHRALGELLCWQKRDPAALKHFDKAIAVMEKAYERCSDGHRDSINDIYRLRIDACQFLGRPEEAKKTASDGAKHFMKNGRFGDFDNRIAHLYRYCVTEALDKSEEKQALAICDTFYAHAKEHLERYADWPCISAKREELSASLAGKAVPGMDGMQRIHGTNWDDGSDLMWMRMAATEEKLWFVKGKWVCGVPMVCQHNKMIASKLFGDRTSASCVAATKDTAFFGGGKGLYKFDSNGNLLRCYSRDDGSFPGSRVTSICEGGSKIYFSFRGSPHTGVAALNLATDKIFVLSPTSREVTPETEPVTSIGCIRWDAVTPRLYTFGYFHYGNNKPLLVREYAWTPQDKTWQKYKIENAPRFVVSNGDETLLVRVVGDQTEFQFVKASQKVTVDLPVPSLMGEPAWDGHCIWVATSSGLYEIERPTGHVKWLAYSQGNPFLSVLKHGKRLYVATARGLYYRWLSPTPESINALAAPDDPSRNVPGAAAAQNAVLASPSRVLPVELTLEDDVKAEITITLDHQDAQRQNFFPGNVRFDLTVTEGQHLLYFRCPGYAAQWRSVTVTDDETNLKPVKVKLFRKRYVILRYAFNTFGKRSLEGNGVEEQRLALSHWTGADHFRRDWQIWQNFSYGKVLDGVPHFNFHRVSSSGYGFVRPAPGTSYEHMREAPESGYRCKNIKAEKGLVLYCRLHGNADKESLGYGKILVEAVTEKPPEDIQVLSRP